MNTPTTLPKPRTWFHHKIMFNTVDSSTGVNTEHEAEVLSDTGNVTKVLFDTLNALNIDPLEVTAVLSIRKPASNEDVALAESKVAIRNATTH